MDPLEHAYLEFQKSRGYQIAPDAPLATKDPTIPFVNSSIAVFKSRIYDGLEIAPTASVQTCFRGQCTTDGLVVFRMLGAISSLQHANNLFKDIADYLTKEIGICEIGDLLCIGNMADTDLEDSWRSISGRDFTWSLSEDNEKYATRWKFGMGENVTGRGITLALQLPLNRCGDTCDFNCPCFRVFPFGNVIHVKSRHSCAEYIEIGIGVPSLYVAREHGDIYAIPSLLYGIEFFANLGYSNTACWELSNISLGVETLISQGNRPGKRGSAYVLRKLVRQLLVKLGHTEIIDRRFSVTPEGIAIFSDATLGVVLEELRLFERTVNKGIRKVDSLRGRRSSLTPEQVLELSQSHGIPLSIVQKILSS